jgi:hypothetical protein
LINFAYCRSDKEGLSLTSSPPVRVKVDTKIRKKIGSGFIVNIKKKKKNTLTHMNRRVREKKMKCRKIQFNYICQ